MPYLLKVLIVCVIGGLTPFILAPIGVPPAVMLAGIFCLSFAFGYMDTVA